MTPRKDDIPRILRTCCANDDNQGENNQNEERDEGTAESPEFRIDRLPETEQELDQVNEILANEIDNLSIVEKEKIMFDVHGIPQACDESDPSNVDEILQQLECEIEKINPKEEYNLAKVSEEQAIFLRHFLTFKLTGHKTSFLLLNMVLFLFLKKQKTK